MDSKNGENHGRSMTEPSGGDFGDRSPSKGLIKHTSNDGREFWVNSKRKEKSKHRRKSQRHRKSKLKSRISGFLLVLLFLAPIVIVGYSFMGDKEQASYGQIRVISDVAGAAIYLDGKFTGEATSTTLRSVNPGNHLISIVKPGYRKFETEVKVKPQNTMELRFNLEPLAEGD